MFLFLEKQAFADSRSRLPVFIPLDCTHTFKSHKATCIKVMTEYDSYSKLMYRKEKKQKKNWKDATENFFPRNFKSTKDEDKNVFLVDNKARRRRRRKTITIKRQQKKFHRESQTTIAWLKNGTWKKRRKCFWALEMVHKQCISIVIMCSRRSFCFMSALGTIFGSVNNSKQCRKKLK